MAAFIARPIKRGLRWSVFSSLELATRRRILDENRCRTGTLAYRMVVILMIDRSRSRFLRHVPIIYVDYPGDLSLKQIYGTFNRAMLRIIPALRSYADPLTAAMVEFYLRSQVGKFWILRLVCGA